MQQVVKAVEAVVALPAYRQEVLADSPAIFDGDTIRFSVVDRGPGLTDAECGQAVQRFWRRSKTPDGSGRGLSIVDTIATRYGGGIRLVPGGEGGLRAELTLPAAHGVTHRRAGVPA